MLFFHGSIGVVYNITPFMKYHPGGKAQLMRGAGNDCTQLFDKVSDHDTMDYNSCEQPGGGRKGLLLLKLMLKLMLIVTFLFTFLFQIHIWVNSESILQKCIVGVYTGAPASSSAVFPLKLGKCPVGDIGYITCI